MDYLVFFRRTLVVQSVCVAGLVLGRTAVAQGDPESGCQPGWVPLSLGMDESVRALTVFDDGSGSALFAGGRFTSAGGGAAGRVAKWNGTSWCPSAAA